MKQLFGCVRHMREYWAQHALTRPFKTFVDIEGWGIENSVKCVSDRCEIDTILSYNHICQNMFILVILKNCCIYILQENLMIIWKLIRITCRKDGKWVLWYFLYCLIEIRSYWLSQWIIKMAINCLKFIEDKEKRVVSSSTIEFNYTGK